MRHTYRNSQEENGGYSDPAALFCSRQPDSGNNSKYLDRLPKEPPVPPGQSATGGTDNFQLEEDFYFAMTLCDTQSFPEATRTCASIAREQAWDAAEKAGIADDIRAMPMGMETVIVEGTSTISGGQRQRLLIARALAQQPRILNFDEATSALDNITQAIVTASLARLHVTRIVIAHRLSTIQSADRGGRQGADLRVERT